MVRKTTSMLNGKIIFSGLVLIAVATGFLFFFDVFKSKRTIHLNSDSTEVVCLVKNSQKKHVHNLYLKLKGKVDGAVLVNKNYRCHLTFFADTISGNFNMDLSGDWYSDTCYLVFKPLDKESSGYIDIVHKFYVSGKNND